MKVLWVIVVFVSFLPALVVGCAPSTAKIDAAITNLSAENARIAQERDAYKKAAARAGSALEAAYVRGIKDGHSSVVCQPSWPTLEVKTAPDGKISVHSLKK